MKPRTIAALATATVALALLLFSRSAQARTVMSTIATTVDENLARANRLAFLAALRWSEGTDDANGYRAIYGHTKDRPRLFSSFAAHPVESGEWAGDKLPDAMCEAAGLSAGCITTAAGAYQMILPTWQRLKALLKLSDFTPASQDQAALWLINEAGAIPAVDAGNFDDAVGAVRRIWASLPGAGYDQPERDIDALRGVFQAAGGQVSA